MNTPSLCRVCHRWPSEVICSDCRGRFAKEVRRCEGCALPLPACAHASPALCGHCLLHPGPLKACVAAVDYAYPWDSLIADLKFRDDPAIARHMVQLLFNSASSRDFVSTCDALIPMPLSGQRLRERGFNQAERIAHALNPDKLDRLSLLRVRHTRAQSDCSKAERLHNVRHAFAVEPKRLSKLRGQHLLLVDDVMTTGASLTQAALALLHAGARQVSAIVIARTPAP
jgi:ComF family protein